MLSSSSSSSMIRRVVPFFTTRIRQNYRLLNSSASALSQPQSQSQSQVEATDSVVMTENCVRRVKELQAGEHKEKMLRLSVEAGGCSGFQYEFSLDDKTNSDDRIFEHDGVKLVVDNVSFDFVKGATVDYVEELIRSAFQARIRTGISSSPERLAILKYEEVPLTTLVGFHWVSTNPSAVGGCSCKSSFMVKQ